MTLKNEAARLFFAISALILVAMLSSTPSHTVILAEPSATIKREVASAEKMTDKINDKKANRKVVKKT